MFYFFLIMALVLPLQGAFITTFCNPHTIVICYWQVWWLLRVVLYPFLEQVFYSCKLVVGKDISDFMITFFFYIFLSTPVKPYKVKSEPLK